jgi:hypothetical protein
MSFLVKLTLATPAKGECWLSQGKAFGARTFGPREKAEQFKTEAAARAAIAKLPSHLGGIAVLYSVEPAD